MQRFCTLKMSCLLLLTMLVCHALGGYAQTLDARPYYKIGNSKIIQKTALTNLETDSLIRLANSGQKIQIMGTASPDGDSVCNQRLAEKRAQSLFRHLKKITRLPDSVFQVSAKVLTWGDLSEFVKRDAKVPAQEDVLAVLDGARMDSVTHKSINQRLKSIKGGAPYLYIKKHIFPLMRTAVTSAGQEPVAFSVEQSMRIAERLNLFKALPHYARQQDSILPVLKPQHEAVNNVLKKKESAKAEIKSHEVCDSQAVDTTTQREAVVSPKMMQSERVDATEPKSRMDVRIWLALIAVLLLLLALLYWYMRRILSKKEAQLAKAGEAIAQRDEKILLLEGQVSQKDSELELMRQKLDEVVIAKGENEQQGQRLYQYIVDGGLAGHWNNNQIRLFSEYYKIVNPLLMDSIQNDYDQLPPSNVFYLILLDMGKTDAEIQKIMNISQTTIRSIRFRIKGKLLKKEE